MNQQPVVRSIWVLADLHLSIGIPSKDMKVFGSQWVDYMDKIAQAWKHKVHLNDLVLLPGDICWAMKLDEAKINLAWIDQLPGKKVMIRGNHDYWWNSVKKVSQILPSSIDIVHHQKAFDWNGVSIGGTRLWDTDEYRFDSYIDFVENPLVSSKAQREEPSAPIFERELSRLKRSLSQMNLQAKLKIAMVHYPPISADLKPSKASKILEEFNIDICVFGHLHNVKKNQNMFGEARGIQYYLTSCDYLDFSPIKIFELPT